MRYLPHTSEEIAAMSAAVGVDDPERLFEVIPPECRRTRPMTLPEAMSEWELDRHMEGLAGRVTPWSRARVFLGAGSYPHFIPEAVRFVTQRSEFVTAYTPYQPEMSQGTLQAIFEYQTLAARLLGLEVANASMYDGASALAEALLMAVRITGRRAVAIARTVHPLYRRVAATYLDPAGIALRELDFGPSGTTDPAGLTDTAELAAVAVQSPNVFGCLEPLAAFADRAHADGALCVAAFTEPLAFGLFANPGRQGADIACGEGQSLGIPPSFGGPGLGMFAGRLAHVRQMPGRLVGETRDLEGRRGFVLTLSTREQHIRREKATSNICTNNSLCALTAAAYLAALGRSGLRELARLNRDKAEYLKRGLAARGVRLPFAAPTFNEFTAVFPPGFRDRYRRLAENGLVAGFPLERWFPELPDHYLLCATEVHERADLDLLIAEVQP